VLSIYVWVNTLTLDFPRVLPKTWRQAHTPFIVDVWSERWSLFSYGYSFSLYITERINRVGEPGFILLNSGCIPWYSCLVLAGWSWKSLECLKWISHGPANRNHTEPFGASPTSNSKHWRYYIIQLWSWVSRITALPFRENLSIQSPMSMHHPWPSWSIKL
jgi:hypothetical protein